MKKISLTVLYCLCFVVAAVFGSVLLVKSFGIAYSSKTTIKIGSQDFSTESQAMVLVEATSGRVLVNHRGDQSLPMASLTKIITAIVAIENCKDLDAKHEIPTNSVGIEGSSIYLKAGEHLSIRELLYGLMLRSGNDSAVAIAQIIGGDVSKFLKLCNDFCKKIGAQNTHLVNPNGLHDDQHFTTAHDLAIITAYALKNDIFAQIVATKEIKIPNELGKYDHRLLKNKNRFLEMLPGADGVKTGYTKKAGRCFVGSATRSSDGMKLVCVLLNCGPMFQECKAVMQIAQEQYSMQQLLPEDGYQASINITGSQQMSAMAKSKTTFCYPLTKEETDLIQIKDTIYPMYEAPIKTDQILGEVQIFLDKQLIFCDNIYSISDIENNSYGGAIGKVIENF